MWRRTVCIGTRIMKRIILPLCVNFTDNAHTIAAYMQYNSFCLCDVKCNIENLDVRIGIHVNYNSFHHR